MDFFLFFPRKVVKLPRTKNVIYITPHVHEPRPRITKPKYKPANAPSQVNALRMIPETANNKPTAAPAIMALFDSDETKENEVLYRINNTIAFAAGTAILSNPLGVNASTKAVIKPVNNPR